MLLPVQQHSGPASVRGCMHHPARLLAWTTKSRTPLTAPSPLPPLQQPELAPQAQDAKLQLAHNVALDLLAGYLTSPQCKAGGGAEVLELLKMMEPGLSSQLQVGAGEVAWRLGLQHVSHLLARRCVLSAWPDHSLAALSAR